MAIMNLTTLKHIPQQSGMCFRFLICGLLLWSAPALQMAAEKTAEPPVEAIDSVIGLLTDSLADGMEAGMEPRFSSLTEEDYRQVAEELGVEVAAIKAVVDIEAGPQHKGFWQPGKPLINFDLSMYRKFAPRRNVSLSKARKRAPEIFNRPNAKKYGSYQAAQHARLDAAAAIDSISAWESTFWGMFQIGGFNWRKCGAGNIKEFVAMMSRSERDQLELFARFIKNSGMVNDIKKHKWLRFALKYNGPKARSRGYHKRLAAAYKRHNSQSQPHKTMQKIEF